MEGLQSVRVNPPTPLHLEHLLRRSRDGSQECQQVDHVFICCSPSVLCCPSVRPSVFVFLAAGHWRSRSSRYRYSNVKPSFLRWPHFS